MKRSFNLFRDISIKGRLMGVSFLILLALALLGWALWHGYTFQRESTRAAVDIEHLSGEFNKLVRLLNEYVITEGSGSSEEQLRLARQSFDESFALTIEGIADIGLAERFKVETASAREEFFTGLEVMLSYDEVTAEDDEAMLIFGRMLAGSEKILAAISATSEEITTVLTARSDKLLKVVATAGVFVPLLVFLLLFSLQRSIARPVKKLAQLASRAADGDLSQRIELDRGDELGSLADSFNGMTESLNAMISRLSEVTTTLAKEVGGAAATVNESSNNISGVVQSQAEAMIVANSASGAMGESMNEVALGAENLHVYAEQSSSAIMQVTDSISTVAEYTTQYADKASEAAASVQQIIGNVRDTFEGIQSVTASSQEVAATVREVMSTVQDVEEKAQSSAEIANRVSKKAAEEGMVSVRAAVDGMARIESTVETLFATVNGLGERSREIEQVLAVIDDITDQTALLALNAAILAAQAGEHGSAFSVLAGEIKSLAARTSDSTQEIGQMIEAVQTESLDSIRKATEGRRAVKEGAALVGEVERALVEISDDSTQASIQASFIKSAAEEEAQFIRFISESVQAIAEKMNTISYSSHQQDAGSREVLAKMEYIAAQADPIKRAIEEQLKSGDQISDSAKKVSEQAVEIAGLIEAQRKRGEELATSITEIDSSTGEVSIKAEEMDRAVSHLVGRSEELLEELKKFSL